MSQPLVLASASPRRREFLAALDLAFSCQAADVDEVGVARGLSPEAGALAVARAKALTVAGRAPRATVLAADTIVVLDGHALGKPADRADAHRMLAALRGRRHTVVTAVVVISPDRAEQSRVVTTSVAMRPWSQEEQATYVASGAPLDKAGAYGIQDQPFAPVATLEGCRCNVVGLPLWTVVELLESCGIAVPRRPASTLAACAACPLSVPAGASEPTG